ncbi:M9 family metallopeptidase [Pseudoduganella violaceinigra]|uniref:M9 family metallopeptidase n=1 Tax=Pseudoduganella violaceinigra TaxID=246602 RepID=UPI0004016E32|nr:M9 family metallopeptidase [Pseudoduganella violaceinigra]
MMLKTIGAAALLLAAQAHAGDKLQQPPAPHQRQSLPPSAEQSKFDLAPTRKPRNDLMPRNMKASMSLMSATPACKDMNTLAGYSGAALAEYVATLPDYECTYPLFSADSALATKIYSSANVSAISSRLASEAGSYNGTNMKLVNLVLYLRAGYYQASGGTIPALTESVRAPLRSALHSLTRGSGLYANNTVAPTTAIETWKLVTNMHDEVQFLPDAKATVARFTNNGTNTTAAEALKQDSAGGGMTGALTVLFRAHTSPDVGTTLSNDISYANTLYSFITANKSALLNSSAGYQLNDASNETFRFMQYANLKPLVKPMVQNTLNNSNMLGADSGMWLAAAQAVKYYDSGNCAQYGVCNFEEQLASAVLKTTYNCSPTLRLRAQDVTPAQVQEICSALATEEGYAHTMLQTNRTPVAHDNNTALELVVFDDYANYSKYASVIYGIDTNNGGMYLEGNPAEAGNQARFIAHEASWLRPTFKVWNLEHEFVHYIDGRFDMYGDFGAGTSVPTVWWIEGIAEYLSLKNNNQTAIDMVRNHKYRLSDIFGNTYAMSDYQDRAYRWGYMATRFMMERHRGDVDQILAKFRVGDYSRYNDFMRDIGTRYDNEFTAWADAATTAGEPPMPDSVSNLPTCSGQASPSYLGKNCAIRNLSSGSRTYLHLIVPAGAKNVKIMSAGGSGNMDMYVALDRYPSTASYDFASTNSGNAENISIASPAANRWYYLTLEAKQPFSGVTVGVTYE